MICFRKWLATALVLLATVAVTAQTTDMQHHTTSATPVVARDVYGVTATSEDGGGIARFAVKTNMLYDLALVPNIGVEVGLGKKWTASADWFYAWWSQDNRHRYWQGYGGYFTVRRYFGGNQSPLLGRGIGGGSHLGIYALGLTYDVEWGGTGYQAAQFGFGGGLEYGYSAKIGRRLCLDFSLGAGFQDGEYKTYDPKDGHYVWQATRKRHWFGPTKAEVSLKWLLGKKGGGR